MTADNTRISVSPLLRPTSVKDVFIIYYRIRLGHTTRLISSHIRIHASQWNGMHPIPPYLSNKIDHDLCRLQHLLHSSHLSLSPLSHSSHLSSLTPSRLDTIIKDFRAHTNEITLADFIRTCISSLTGERRCGSARNYRALLASILRFSDGTSPFLRDISPEWAEQYMEWLLQSSLSQNSVNFYMRILKAVIHKAQRQSLLAASDIFGNIRLSMPATKKRAIYADIMRRILRLDLENEPRLQLARDIFLFSFMTRGMPFVDVIRLTKENISGNRLTYRRHKTGVPLQITLEPPALKILRRHSAAGQFHLFPLLSDKEYSGQNPTPKEKNGMIADRLREEEYKEYRLALGRYNYWLGKIGEMAGIPGRLSSYVPRHSWATLQQRSHVPVSVISAALGHRSERTTLSYLAGIEDREIDEANRRLLDNVLTNLA